jgi:pyrimidine operon attenuation protein/uracil phosphoribosyltransferase
MALIMDGDALTRVLLRIAHEMAEKNPGVEDVVLAGIRTRGVPLAERIARNLGRIEGVQPPVIAIDVEPYRDDRERGLEGRRATWTGQPDLAGRRVILVDDVLYTGRTVRAALDAVVDRGRPAAVQLAVLVDRGHRELPIRADYVGKNIPTSRLESVHVWLREIDGRDAVSLEKEGVEDSQ